MNLLVLFGLLIGLIVLLLLLLSLFVMKPKREKKRALQKREVQKRGEHKSLQEYLDIIRERSSTTKELADAVDNILKYYGSIHSKLGIRIHPDFKIYALALVQICRHPHTNKDIILKFNRGLEKQNPSYAKEINDAITRGLNSRS